MAVVRKKQDDKCLEALRDLINSGGSNGGGGGVGTIGGGGGGGGGGNRQCFDCGQRGPTYVNMTIGSFVCTRCSGVLRGLTPPHRVKSISMATFTPKEIEFLKSHGNDACAKTWLGLWDPKRVVPQDQRDLMIDKYERKRYYLEPASPLKALTNTTNVKSITTNNNNNNNININNNHSNNNNNSIVNVKSQNNCSQLGPSNSEQRTTANGLHSKINAGATGSTAVPAITINTINHVISRPQVHLQQNHQSLKSNQILLHENHNNKNNGQQQQQQQQQQQHQNQLASQIVDAFGLSCNINGSNNVSALISTSNVGGSGINNNNNNNNNKFHSDFVADFNLANIFNGTAPNMPSKTTNVTNGAMVARPTTGAAINSNTKVQPINGDSTELNHLKNNQYNQQANCNGSNGTITNGPIENFADFEHAPIIYNAPGLTTSTTFVNGDNKTVLKRNLNDNCNKTNKTPSEDRYAALKDLDDQLRESKAAAATMAVTSATMTNNLMNPCINNNHNNGINPFDHIITSDQQQQHQLYNPFKNFNGTATTVGTLMNNNNNALNDHMFGQMTLISHNKAEATTAAAAKATTSTINGFIGTQKSQINRNSFNYTTTTNKTSSSSGYYAIPTINDGIKYSNGNMDNDVYGDDLTGVGGLYNNTTTTALNNFLYCPLTKRMAAAAAATTGNNPFASTNAVQSNNPFL